MLLEVHVLAFPRTASQTNDVLIPTWHGAGPEGFIGYNELSKSRKLLDAHSPSSGVEFIFDTSTNTIIVARSAGEAGTGFHRTLVNSINANPDNIVAGMFYRNKAGKVVTNEKTGTYNQNWTNNSRYKFKKGMKNLGIEHEHLDGVF